ncbi:MAG: aldo/keto reductase [Sphingomonadales bacterium]
MRLSLGTAQFGLAYGITNQAGQVPAQTVKGILETAADKGIGHIDTAAAYGSAETVLAGQLGAFEVTSKIPSLEGLTPEAARAKVASSIEESKVKLGPGLTTILFHSAADLLRPDWQSLWETAAAQGLPKLGVSVYTGDEVSAILGRVTPDVVQLPLNLLDQRLLDDGTLSQLKGLGCEVEARSFFLQVVLFSAPAALPSAVQTLAPYITAIRSAAASAEASVLDLCLSFLKLTGFVDRAVVGVTTVDELIAIHESWQRPIPAVPYQNFRVSEPHLVDPRLWRDTRQQNLKLAS